MDKLEFKKKVLEKAREKQLALIADFKLRIDYIRKSELIVNEGQRDHDQESLDEFGMKMVDNLSTQRNFAVEEMELLYKMKVDEPLHDRVALGSIVETDKRTFFVSVSIESFTVGGQELFGISEKAPLYEAMKGKKAGEAFNYQGAQYKILKVY